MVFSLFQYYFVVNFLFLFSASHWVILIALSLTSLIFFLCMLQFLLSLSNGVLFHLLYFRPLEFYLVLLINFVVLKK